MLDRVLTTIESRRHQSLAALSEFLSIPSVSAKPDHVAHIQQCAQWLADQLRFAALEVSIMSTGAAEKHGNPIVVAKNKHVAGRPTVLLYGHYDVQPPEPLEEWTTPPFTPTVRPDPAGFPAVYARGAADDKGQVWCHVEAILAWQAHGGVPVNLIMLIEGEEEVGSHHLGDFIRENKQHLKCDIAVISDTNQFARNVPAITYGLRGLVYEEVFLTGPSHDLHSGMFGGAVPNPANVLCEMLASLHDKNGRITIPGFYDDVVSLSQRERELWASLPFNEQQFLGELGIPSGNGEAGFTSLERRWARPTLDINGMTSGYQGPGAKTVIPSKASAKVSMRLVPHMDPVKVQRAFRQALRDRCPANCKLEFTSYGTSPAVLVPIDNPATKLAAEALEIGFGTTPTFMREGGSIPVVGLLKKELGVDTLLIGFGLPDDRVHSPNEKFDLGALYNGSRTAAALYAKLANLPTKSLPIA